MNKLEQAALGYARLLNWRVFPLHSLADGRCTCGKACNSPGKHPCIKAWQDGNGGPALIVINTLQKVRGDAPRGVNAYQADYDTMTALKRIADDYRAAIVMVHHTNKLRAVTDVYDKISGSNGLMGCADTTIVIERERGQDEATVHFEGRDVWGDDFIIRFDGGRWNIVSNNAMEYFAGSEYDADPIVQTFRALITEHPQGVRWTYDSIAAKGLEVLGYSPFIDGRACSKRLREGLAADILKNDNVLVECGINTTGGKGVRLTLKLPRTSFQTKITDEDA